MDEIIDEVVGQISNSYRNKLNDVLNTCDSPIEKALFIFLIQNFNKKYTDRFNLLFGKEIYAIYTDDDLIEKADNHKIKKFNYNRFYYLTDNYKFRYRFKNIIISDIDLVGNPLYEIKDGKISMNRYEQDVQRNIVIEPQFQVINEKEGVFYYIDIAVYEEVYLKFDNKRIVTNKIAIECDGHQFHSSKKQIMRDNMRSRRLSILGWKVMRYSGSEIYAESKKEMKNVFEEIVEILGME